MLDSAVYAPPPSLGDIVEAIWDVDAPDADIARAMAVKVLPTASSVMVVHYRAPISSDRRNYEGCAYRSVVTGVQRETVTLQPRGPVGSLVVRFRPGAAARVFGMEMDAFADANVELADLFGDAAQDRLENDLRGASGKAARLAVIGQFLTPRVRRDADPLVIEAVRRLRRDSAQPVGKLARALDISERQLARRFLASIGATPKQVARVLRGEGLIAARHRGAAWADVAALCGFNDQAHMIRDFKALAGITPDAHVREAFTGPRRELNTALAMAGFYNTAFV
jgi:AraC-like DNA-binding protein